MQMLEVSKKLKEKDEFTLFFKGRPANFFDEFVMSLFVDRLISDYELGIVRGLHALPSKRRTSFPLALLVHSWCKCFFCRVRRV